MKAADDIFNSGAYTKLITKMQNVENTVKNGAMQDGYFKPYSLPGRKKGLLIILDAQTRYLSTSSVDSDFNSFSGLVNPTGNFPYMGHESFEIRPGQYNIIALSATRVDADDNMKNLNADDRKCLFSEESSDLKIYKNYTYTNCLFECGLHAAVEKYMCIPWYFPSVGETIAMCDPWATQSFLKYIDELTDEKCSHCLPECSNTIYEKRITAIPFRKCDSSNLEIRSQFHQYFMSCFSIQEV